jgi:hypothetical protein
VFTKDNVVEDVGLLKPTVRLDRGNYGVDQRCFIAHSFEPPRVSAEAGFAHFGIHLCFLLNWVSMLDSIQK